MHSQTASGAFASRLALPAQMVSYFWANKSILPSTCVCVCVCLHLPLRASLFPFFTKFLDGTLEPLFLPLFSFILGGGAFEAKISSQVLLCTSEYPNCIPVSSSRHLESSFGRAGQAVLVCPFVLFAGRTAPDDTTCPREAVRPRNGRKSDSSSRRQDQIKANEICLTVAVCKTRALERKIVPGRNCCCWTRQVRARQSRLRKWQLNLVGVFPSPRLLRL